MTEEITAEMVEEVFADIQEFGNLTQIRCDCCDERRDLSHNDAQYIANQINEDLEDKKISYSMFDKSIDDYIRKFFGDI